ncbi:hypothetical protein GIB67_029122, partial [Kingdonia uniflora]
MLGPYSFISISDGVEELDDVGHNRKNMVEVFVAMKIVRNFFKGFGLAYHLGVLADLPTIGIGKNISFIHLKPTSALKTTSISISKIYVYVKMSIGFYNSDCYLKISQPTFRDLPYMSLLFNRDSITFYPCQLHHVVCLTQSRASGMMAFDYVWLSSTTLCLLTLVESGEYATTIAPILDRSTFGYVEKKLEAEEVRFKMAEPIQNDEKDIYGSLEDITPLMIDVRNSLKEVDKKSEVKEKLYKVRRDFFGRIDNLVIDQDLVNTANSQSIIEEVVGTVKSAVVVDMRPPWGSWSVVPKKTSSETSKKKYVDESETEVQKTMDAYTSGMEKLENWLVGIESLNTFFSDGQRNLTKVKNFNAFLRMKQLKATYEKDVRDKVTNVRKAMEQEQSKLLDVVRAKINEEKLTPDVRMAIDIIEDDVMVEADGAHPGEIERTSEERLFACYVKDGHEMASNENEYQMYILRWVSGFRIEKNKTSLR